MFALLLTTQTLVGQEWYSSNWQYRMPVAVSNPGTLGLWDFQVQIDLASPGNFDFNKCLGDGSDIRLTASDGKTLIPFWIEYWSPSSATIWVKVPNIPISGTTIYLYYGNASPSIPSSNPVETPPVGPYDRAEANPIIPFGATASNLLAENIVFDRVTNHYWMCMANYDDRAISLCYSDTPTDPDSWIWSGNVITSFTSFLAGAPHLILHNNTWYIFYSDVPDIKVATASSVNGPYTIAPSSILEPSGPSAWDSFRVDEPYVFQRTDGTWILIYMGDQGVIGDFVEQVGYATADNILGPYTAYSGNPVIRFGEPGSYDAGTIADPWVYYSLGKYYIGYAASNTRHEPFYSACATTTDWQTFTKIGLILPLAASGWDATNSFRGAITRINDTYVYSYTGGVGTPLTFRMGIATKPVFMAPPDIINNPEEVFDFYDAFDGTSIDLTKWYFTNGYEYQTVVNGGYLNITTEPSVVLTRLSGTSFFGMNYMGETRMSHPDQGEVNMCAETGFADQSWNTVRILDDYPEITTHWQREAKLGSPDRFVAMAQTADPGFHTFRVSRYGTNTAGFQIDNNPTETTTTDVPTLDLPPFIMSVGIPDYNHVIVDWVRVRKWLGVAPTMIFGSEETSSFRRWIGGLSTDWNTGGNWSDGNVPGSSTDVVIRVGTFQPHVTASGALCKDLTIDAGASMFIDAGGALTVSGDLTNNGTTEIGSTGVASSGSLIVYGSSDGNVTYNRTMPPDALYHYISSPVNLTATPSGTFYPWDEVAGDWGGPTTSIASGRGYTIIGGASLSFTGSLVTSDLNIDATSPYSDVIATSLENYDSRSYATLRNEGESYGGGGWNLLGNPYTSAILVTDFLTTNTGSFDPNYIAVFLYDGSSYNYIGYSTGWEVDNPTQLSQSHIQAGQGFFVLAMNNYSTFTFDRSMRGHSTGAVMFKSTKEEGRWPGLQLKVKTGEVENLTTIVFNEKMTIGLDPGYDVGLRSYGPGAGIYTALVKDNGINFTRQALPINGSVKNIIPIGIDFEDGGDVTFSAEIEQLRNYKFILEDRVTGIFTDLSTNSYNVTLPGKTYGTGRFFLHVSTSRNQRQKSESPNLLDLRIWSSYSRQVNIQGSVSDKATCQVYDIRGDKIFELHLAGSDYNSFTLPSVGSGVCIITVIDGAKIVTQRVVIL